jgi:glycogen operon protein
VKLIAEPWDVGEGGYQVGQFPPGWAEWNGKYRDCMRDYWRGEGSMLGEFAERFTGSSDLYKNDNRNPTASINFITAHDGFTLNDLVSYNERHNEANKEDNKDGHQDNRSWNCGAEGPTEDAGINTLRQRQRRNFLATLFLSQGVPMLLAGDEMGHTQDNIISWIDWEKADQDLIKFTSQLIRLRRDHHAFSRKMWFKGREVRKAGLTDIAWFKPDGTEMNEGDWNDGFAKSLAIFLNGDGLHAVDEFGRQLVDDSFFMIFNGHPGPLEFKLPPEKYGQGWKKLWDTTVPATERKVNYRPGEMIKAGDRSVILLQAPRTKNVGAVQADGNTQNP